MTLDASIDARRRSLLEALSAGVSFAPPAEFRSGWLATPEGDVRIGRMSPEALEALRKEPGFESGGERVLLQPGAEESADALLERLGRKAQAAGFALHWRNEQLDLFPMPPSCRQKPIARMERALFRTFGSRTRVVRLLAETDECGPARSWLLARRASHKSIGAGLWDNLAAGMVTAGETPVEAMRREAMEECGLDAPDLAFERTGSRLVERPVDGGWMSESNIRFQIRLPADFTPRSMDGEAEAFRWFTTEEVFDLIEAGGMMPGAALALLDQI